jgi:hypothetical protein
LDVVGTSWSWANSTFQFTIGSLSTTINGREYESSIYIVVKVAASDSLCFHKSGTWPALTTRLFALGFVNGALTQPLQSLYLELSNAKNLNSNGSDWVCSPTPTESLLTSNLFSKPNGGACREPTAERVIFGTKSMNNVLEAAVAMVAIAGGAEPTAAAAAAAAQGEIAATPVLLLSLWKELSATQSTPIPGAENKIVFRMRSAASLVPGDTITFSGLTGFSTPNAPDIGCINSTV